MSVGILIGSVGILIGSVGIMNWWYYDCRDFDCRDFETLPFGYIGVGGVHACQVG